MRSIVFAVCAALSTASIAADPPYLGTAFLDPDIVVPSDPSSFVGVTAKGSGVRTMFDRRVNAFVPIDARLFEARFSDAPAVEVQVNPEFDSADAHVTAGFYAHAIGQLPRGLREQLRTVWIHKGDQPFGGGNQNILIHTGSLAQGYLAGGTLEEILMHEAVHTSLDPLYATADTWVAAQTADGVAISDYARDSPEREDLAESFVPYYAARHRPERISAEMKNTIEQTIPARIAFFDSLQLDVRPTVFDAAGTDQVWLTGAGPFIGKVLQIDEMIFAHRGVFGPAFDADRITRPRWGSLQITFLSCASARVDYASDNPKYGSGGYLLDRLPSPAQRECEAVGFGNTTNLDWTVGAWFNSAERSGEGFLIEAIEGNVGFVAWFTFGPQP